MQGRLLGISTAILTRGGGSIGVGFAIPSNLVARVVEATGVGQWRFLRPWSGVSGQAVDMGMSEALGLDAPAGVMLTALHAESPFATAGLAAGDVLLSLDGHPVCSPQEVEFRLAVTGTGRDATVRYVRDGVETEVTVRLASPPVMDRGETVLGPETALAGLTVARLDPALIEELGLPPDATGVVVTATEGLAARAGLQRGDVILAINGLAVASPAEVADAAAEQRRAWRIDVVRQGRAIRLLFRF